MAAGGLCQRRCPCRERSLRSANLFLCLVFIFPSKQNFSFGMWPVAEWGKYKEKKAFNWLKINSVFMNTLANFTEGWDFFIFSFVRDTGGNFSILKGISYYYFFWYLLDSMSVWAVCWHLTLFCDCTWRWGSARICFCFEMEWPFSAHRGLQPDSFYLRPKMITPIDSASCQSTARLTAIVQVMACCCLLSP